MDLNDLVKWQNEKSTRSVEIKIKNREFNIWVYDYDLRCGQYIKEMEEINLEAEYKKMMLLQLKEAKAALGEE